MQFDVAVSMNSVPIYNGQKKKIQIESRAPRTESAPTGLDRDNGWNLSSSYSYPILHFFMDML